MKVYGNYNTIFSELNQKCNGHLQKPGTKKSLNIMGKIHELTLFVNPVLKDKVHISQEGLAYMKGNLHKEENVPDYMPMPQEEQEVYDHIQSHLNVNTLTTCDSTEIISKDLRKMYEDLQSKEADFLDINGHVGNLMKAYTHMYNKIVDGYNDGTREVWIKDNSTGDDFNGLEFMSNGRIERYRKLTMEEELATLDLAFEKYAKDIEDGVNYAIMIDRVSPSVLKTMEELKKIAGERHDRNIMQELEAKENITQERELKEIKEKYERPKKVPIYQMLMDARLDFYRVEHATFNICGGGKIHQCMVKLGDEYASSG